MKGVRDRNKGWVCLRYIVCIHEIPRELIKYILTKSIKGCEIASLSSSDDGC